MALSGSSRIVRQLGPERPWWRRRGLQGAKCCGHYSAAATAKNIYPNEFGPCQVVAKTAAARPSNTLLDDLKRLPRPDARARVRLAMWKPRWRWEGQRLFLSLAASLIGSAAHSCTHAGWGASESGRQRKRHPLTHCHTCTRTSKRAETHIFLHIVFQHPWTINLAAYVSLTVSPSAFTCSTQKSLP